MMSSSGASAFPGGGAGAIRTDITITAITRTLTMDPVIIRTVTMDTVDTRTAMDTAGTVTTVVPVMGIAMDAERIMDMDMAAELVTESLWQPIRACPEFAESVTRPGRARYRIVLDADF